MHYITRDEVAGRLNDRRTSSSFPGAIRDGDYDPVSPFAYYALMFHPELAHLVVDRDSAMTGLAAPSTATPGVSTLRFRYATALHPVVFMTLGLQSWRVDAIAPRDEAFLAAAVEGLARLSGDSPSGGEDFRALVDQWVTLVVWLSLPAGARVDLALTSAAFPEFCGCVFLTRLAFFHIAPDVVFRKPFLYALMDNLIHEALHHRLGATLAAEPGYLPDVALSGRPVVDVPWRQDRWTYEKALQTLYVYKHLAHVRRTALAQLGAGDLHSPTLEAAHHDAIRCGEILTRELRRVAPAIVGAASRDLLEAIVSI